jgi:hypothetical protein
MGSVVSGANQAGVDTAAGLDDTASAARVRLISQEQYFNTLDYVFGPNVTVSAHFTPFRRTEGLLANGASSAGVTPGLMMEFQRTAGAVASQVVSPSNRNFLPCKPAREDRADKACATQFISSMGLMLHRRPLDAKAQAALVKDAGETATRLKDFYAGLAVALEGLLVSPDMLFIVDRYEPDPEHAGRTRLDAYSLASRLSFFLWNAGPDTELLRAASGGELHTAAGRAKAVDRMLASPRFETGVRAFFDDMLAFEELAILTKDPGIYPAFTGATVADAREQTLRTIVDLLVTKNQDYRELFTTRETFISPSLALLYDVSAPPGWSRYESPADSPRAGLLTQISFLAGHAHPGRSSPTLRGKALRELLLCQIVPRPPPDVDFSLLEDPKSVLKTARERLDAHQSNPICAGCHKVTDPIGLALEHFDGAGQYRETEQGAEIDASGVLDGKSFADAGVLGEVLKNNPSLPSCLVKRVYSYGVGGAAKTDDKTVLPHFRKSFADSGYRVPELMKSIALSAPFSTIAAPPVAQTAATRTGEPK